MADKKAPIWDELDALVNLPYKKLGSDVCIPFFRCGSSPGDPFNFRYVLDKDVKVFAARDERSAVLLSVTQAAIREDYDGGEPKEWTAVFTPSGQVGYIQSAKLHSFTGYRIFCKEDGKGRWMIHTIIAGD